MKTLYKIIIGLAIIILVLGGVLLYWPASKPSITVKPQVSDYKNITYTIENQPVTLVNGYSEKEAAPGSASKIITNYFGNEAFGDVNGDGAPDIAFLLTQQTGGSGTFYYLAVALETTTGYQSTNTIFLGVRIAPQTTEIQNGIITVNYPERKPSDPMTATPSVGISKHFKVENGQLIEIKP